MNILVIGSGGREHALVCKIARSRLAGKIFCAPGNAGISGLAECLDIKAEDTQKLLLFAQKEKIDLTVVGPELPLAAGIVDEFQKRGLKIFGPNKNAAQLEASKIFAKERMRRLGVPTARFSVCEDLAQIDKAAQDLGIPLVIKAEGLCAGKGVVVAQSRQEAHVSAGNFFSGALGGAGKKIVAEEFLRGQEASVMVLTDSMTAVPLAASQDHKRVFDNDTGPNTGGMGAYSPAPMVTPGLFKEILEKIIYRALEGLAKEGIEYKGVLYAGIMLTAEGPKALEFNCRFGDPETQAVLPRLKSDLVELMLAVVEGKLSRYAKLDWDERACVCVVCASKGYPGSYESGKEIFGLEEAAKIKDVAVFHAGTIQKTEDRGQRTEKARYWTNGGRVLGVSGLGNGLKDAMDKTYQAIGKIDFEGMHYRRDIGVKGLKQC